MWERFGDASLVRMATLRRSAVGLARQYQTYAVNDGSHLGDALSKEIATVKLAFDRHEAPAPSAKSPLVFLHGIFGSKSNTRTVAKQLARSMSRDVYCLDLRNFGDSPHAARLDYPALAADVERFVDEQQFGQKPVLVGHSMGAKTAMAVTLRRPELALMLVAVDNAPVCLSSSAGPFGRYIRQIRYSLEAQRATSVKQIDAELAKVEPSKEVRQFLLTNINRGKKDEVCTSKIPLEIIADAISAGNIALWPYDSAVARWSRGPALFVRGTQSKYIPDEVIPDIGQYFPDFEVRDVNSGHWVISEKPAEFMDVLQEFVERREAD